MIQHNISNARFRDRALASAHKLAWRFFGAGARSLHWSTTTSIVDWNVPSFASKSVRPLRVLNRQQIDCCSPTAGPCRESVEVWANVGSDTQDDETQCDEVVFATSGSNGLHGASFTHDMLSGLGRLTEDDLPGDKSLVEA